MAKIQLAVNGKGSGHKAVTDFVMSEKFGLDWQQYEYQRIQDLMLVLSIVNKPTKDVITNRIDSLDRR